ncbi:MAG: hypothetical protein ACO3ZG_04790 [Kiritimatiellia bacterium]
MYQYRIVDHAISKARVALAAFAVFSFLLLGSVIFNLFFSLLDYDLTLANIFGGVCIAALLLAWRYLRRQRRSMRILDACDIETDEDSRQTELVAHLKHLIFCIRRLSTQRLLGPTQTKEMLRQSLELQQSLQHHPLRDDLIRGIDTAWERIIQPAHEQLDAINRQVTRAKVVAAAQDIYQPPFPLFPPLVALYHQATLISEITDLYLPQPSMREYLRIMRDTWQVMTKGDFVRMGQQLFLGIEARHHLGPAGKDIGQAVSLAWVIRCSARAATLRCSVFNDWSLSDCINEMNEYIATEGIKDLHQSLIEDLKPVLLPVIRRHAPLAPGVDAVAVANETWTTLIKALEATMQTLTIEAERNRHDAYRPQPVRSESPSTPPLQGPAPRLRRAKRRKTNRTLFQRFKKWLRTSPYPYTG